MPARFRTVWICSTLATGLAALVLWNGVSPAQQKAPEKVKDRDLQAFMRKKLAASTQILEGLCTDDMKLVAEGARTLNTMSDAEKWHVSNDVMYKQFSNEFRQITRDLVKAAEEEKPDRVTLKWLDATVSCLDCHRFVRGARIAKSNTAP